MVCCSQVYAICFLLVQHLQQLIPDTSEKAIEEASEAAKGDTNAAVNHLLNSQDQSGSAKGDIDAGSHAIGTNSGPVTPLGINNFKFNICYQPFHVKVVSVPTLEASRAVLQAQPSSESIAF